MFIFGLFTLLFLGAIFYGILFVLKKYEKKNWKYELLSAVIVVSFFKWAFLDITRVPTGSMEKTLLPGDFVLISKLHYGPRTPSTLLQIPLTHQTTKFLELKSYLSWIQIPFFRFPGFTWIKRNDAVVFNTPSDKNMPIDVRTFYVKRCIGLPGEYIKMIDGNYYVNNVKIENAPNKVFKYVVKSKQRLSKNFFKKFNIVEIENIGENLYEVNILNKYDVKKTVENLKNNYCIEDVKILSQDTGSPSIIEKFDGYIDVVNWGGDKGILIPKIGLEIELSTENIARYGEYIIDECGKKNVKIVNKDIYIYGKKVTKYTFKHNYYFMIGDNIYNSWDSRFWGFVRDDSIYAKPLLVIFSKSQESLLGGFKLRFLKTMW